MLHYKGGATHRWEKVVDVVLMVFGAILMMYTTTLTVISWSKGSVSAPGYCDQQ